MQQKDNKEMGSVLSVAQRAEIATASQRRRSVVRRNQKLQREYVAAKA